MVSKPFSISFPEKLLKCLDEHCNKYGGTRSKVLQKAAKSFLKSVGESNEK